MKALLVVDIQYDFLPGGNLAVENGDAIIPVINRLIPDYPLVVATQDWHPPGHLSFASSHSGKKPFETIDLNGIEQILWPDHCVWGTRGAAFPESLNLDRVVAVFRKGMDPEVDSYSAFFDNGRRHKTGLAEWLKGMGVETLHIGGLAAEVCVADTARDAAREGFKAVIIKDATRALSEDDFQGLASELGTLGISLMTSQELQGD